VIFIDENTLSHFDDLNWNDKRDWDHCVDEDNIGEESDDAIDSGSIVERDIGVSRFVAIVEHNCQHTTDNAKYNLYNQYEAENVVNFDLNLWHFIGSAFWIFHDLRISSGIDGESIDPLCVHKSGSSP